MIRFIRGMRGGAAAAVVIVAAASLCQVSGVAIARGDIPRAALAPGSINNVLVIELENEDASSTFGPGSPATYLNNTLVPKGELLQNYYAIGHVSLDNYLAQISGQAPTTNTATDCYGTYTNVLPGSADPNTSTEPGQVDGNGCVYPTGVQTISNQLDAVDPPNPTTNVASWREYAEDMGNDATRDGGAADPLGGTDCAHPAIGGADKTESAEPADQYTDRHNPFIYFHSVIDNTAECNANVVPLGTAAVGTPSTFNGVSLADTFTGHLASDLSSIATTPKFGFITPNLCDDGHDGTCAGTNLEGGKTGDLTGADLWFKHYMPLIMASPAYQSGQMLVVITADEGALGDATSCCNEQSGPNDSSITGGGKVGALLLNNQFIVPGTVDTTGSYNHYSALRSYEDLLGLTTGGTDGFGHLGFGAVPGLTPFGQDIFQPASPPTSIVTNPVSQSVTSGGSLTFTAAANIVTPSVQWQASLNGGGTWSNISGANGTSVTTGKLNAFESGWEVRALFTNHDGSLASQAATITVNPTSVVLPANGASVSGSQYLDAIATPGSTKVQFELTGGSLNQAVIGTATPTIYGWLSNWNSTTVPNGTYTLNSVATLPGGSTGAGPGISVTVNNAAPTTAVVLPASGANLSASQLLDAVASPGVTKVSYEITGGALTDSVIGTATPTIYGWLFNWSTSTVSNGTYALQSVASYSGGVSGTSPPITVTVSN